METYFAGLKSCHCRDKMISPVRSARTEPPFCETGFPWRRLGEYVDTRRATLVSYHEYILISIRPFDLMPVRRRWFVGSLGGYVE